MTAEIRRRCAAAPRCRQPIVFNVDLNSWRSISCEKHLGVLVARKLNGASSDHITVTLRDGGAR